MSSSSSDAPFRTIRVDPARLTALLNRLDEEGTGVGANRRRSKRFDFRVGTCVVYMQQPGSVGAVRFSVSTRNINDHGLAFLHARYVHIGSKCVVQLVNRSGAWSDIEATVVRCRYLEGTLHEVAVLFEQPIDPGDFCAAAVVRHVLVADDDPMIARMALYHLANLNSQVDQVQNGRDAVEHALQNAYNVILMDLDMPVLDGFEATRQIRARGCRTPIIAVTGLQSPADRERALAAGCDTILPKPFTRGELVAAMDLVQLEPLLSTLQADGELAELIAEFVASLPKDVRRLEEAFQKTDFQGLQSAARKLRSEGGAFGFDPISVAAGQLEKAIIESASTQRVQILLNELIKYCLLARAR